MCYQENVISRSILYEVPSDENSSSSSGCPDADKSIHNAVYTNPIEKGDHTNSKSQVKNLNIIVIDGTKSPIEKWKNRASLFVPTT